MDFEQVFIFAVCLFVTGRLSRAEECIKIQDNKCSCKTSKILVDLRKLTELSIKKNEYTYDFQPCNGVSKCGIYPGSEVAVCQRSDDGKNVFDAGDLKSVVFTGDPATDSLQLNYTANRVFPTRISVISVKCDRSTEGKLTSIKEGPENTYNFVLNTKYSCAASNSKDKKKISTGSVLLIIFFVFVGIYFIAGILFLKFARGAQGTEAIPNYEFWASLPGYIKDGVLFTCRGCKTESAYSQI